MRPCAGVDWVTSEWSGCDNKCGLASETRRVHCATQKGEVWPDELCSGEEMPKLIRECKMSKLCDFEWYAAQWSEVSLSFVYKYWVCSMEVALVNGTCFKCFAKSTYSSEQLAYKSNDIRSPLMEFSQFLSDREKRFLTFYQLG